MMKQLTLAVLLSTAFVVAVPAIGNEPLPVEQEEVGYKERVIGVWSRTTERTADLRDGLFNKDERLHRVQAQVETQKQIIAELQNDLANLQIRTDVEHIQITQCSERVTSYLKSLTSE